MKIRVLYQDRIARLLKAETGLIIEQRSEHTDAMNVTTEVWTQWYWVPGTKYHNLFSCGSEQNYMPDPRVDWMMKALAALAERVGNQ